MEVLELCENTSGDQFVELIKYCFSRSDLFTLTRYGGHGKLEDQKQSPTEVERNWQNLRAILEQYGVAPQAIQEMQEMAENPGKMYEQHDMILSAFDECRIETFKSARWFCGGTIPDMDIDLYPASDRARDILLAHYDNAYLQSGKRMVVLPADICFFRNGSCWLGSCSHEGICYALPENEEDASELMKHGVWRQAKDGFPRENMLLTSRLLAELRKSRFIEVD